jgi:hypothetical protein
MPFASAPSAKPRSHLVTFYSWPNTLKYAQPVDNSVDGIIVDPIKTPVSGFKHHCSFFVHMNKKPEKQVFASKLRTDPQLRS